MSDKIKNPMIDEFLKEPLIKWYASYLSASEKENLTYESFIDGPSIHNVFLQFDSRTQDVDVVPSNGDPTVRARNLAKILDNLRWFYEEQRNSLISRLPNVEELSQDPESHIKEAKLLLRLLLGCALHCSEKGAILDRIANEMDHNTKCAIHKNEEAIKKIEITYDKLESVLLSENISERLRQLICNAYVNTCHGSLLPEEEISHSKNTIENEIKKQKRFLTELNQKNLELTDCKEELERKEKENQENLDKIKKEHAKTLKEKQCTINLQNDKIFQLEKENGFYQEKLFASNDYEKRLDELKNDNEKLKDNLKSIAEHFESSEDENKILKAKLNKLTERIVLLNEDKFAINEKYEELLKENEQLKEITEEQAKVLLNDTHAKSELSLSFENTSLLVTGSLSEQLSNNVQSETLKLQLENRRLLNQLNQLRDISFNETSKLLEVESENEKLMSEIQALKDKLSNFDQVQNAPSDEKNNFKKLLENEWKRSAELEHKLRSTMKKLDERKALKDTLNEMNIKEAELKSKIVALESQKKNASKEALKQRILLDEKDTELQKALKTVGDLENKLYSLENKMNRTSKSFSGESKLINVKEFINDSNNLNADDNLPSNSLTKQEKKSNDVKLEALIKSFESRVSLEGVMINKLSIEKDTYFAENIDQYVTISQHNKLMDEYQVALEDKNKTECELQRMCNLLGNLENDLKNSKTECESVKKNCIDLYNFRERLQKALDVKDIKIARLKAQVDTSNHKYNALMKLNQVLEKDKRELMEHTNDLVKRLHDFHNQSIEDRERFHSEEMKNTEKYNSLQRKKEKLEEKIMEQFKDNSDPGKKRRSSGIFYKVSKVGSKILSKGRRSLAPSDTGSVTNVSSEFEFLKGYQSDYSSDSQSCPRIPREYSASDFGLRRVSTGKTKRNAADIFSDFNPSGFTFGYETPKSKRSVSSTSFGECENDFQEDLEGTLHENPFEDQPEISAINNKAQLGKSNKSSSELIKNQKQDATRSDSSYKWSEQGCI